MQEIKEDPIAHVTFTGGDPFFQAEAFSELAARIKKETDKTIWCYTGFLFEYLKKNTLYYNLLKYLDVLVDGPFVQAKKNLMLRFRGSENQRILDVPRSLEQNTAVLWQDWQTERK